MRINRFSIALVMIAVLSSWSGDELSEGVLKRPSQNCKGYTIVEYGKGVNCKGDTVALEKRGGLQVLALQNKEIRNAYW